MVPQRKWVPVSNLDSHLVPTKVTDSPDTDKQSISDMHFDPVGQVVYLAYYKYGASRIARLDPDTGSFTQWSFREAYGVAADETGTKVFMLGYSSITGTIALFPSLSECDTQGTSQRILANGGEAALVSGAKTPNALYAFGFQLVYYGGILYGVHRKTVAEPTNQGSCIFSYALDTEEIKEFAFNCDLNDGTVDGAVGAARANHLRGISVLEDGSWLYVVQDASRICKVLRSTGWAITIGDPKAYAGCRAIWHHPVFPDTLLIARKSGFFHLMDAVGADSAPTLLSVAGSMMPRAFTYDSRTGALYVGSDIDGRVTRLCCFFYHEGSTRTQGVPGNASTVAYFDYAEQHELGNRTVARSAIVKSIISGVAAIDIGAFLYNPVREEFYATEIQAGFPQVFKAGVSTYLDEGTPWSFAATLPAGAFSGRSLAVAVSVNGEDLYVSWPGLKQLFVCSLLSVAQAAKNHAGQALSTGEWRQVSKNTFSGFTQHVAGGSNSHMVVGVDAGNNMLLRMPAGSSKAIEQLACSPFFGNQVPSVDDNLLLAKCNTPVAIALGPDGTYLFAEQDGRIRKVFQTFVSTVLPLRADTAQLQLHPHFAGDSFLSAYRVGVRSVWAGKANEYINLAASSGSWDGGPLPLSAAPWRPDLVSAFSGLHLVQDSGEVLVSKNNVIISICCLFTRMEGVQITPPEELGSMKVSGTFVASMEPNRQAEIRFPFYAPLHGHLLFFHVTQSASTGNIAWIHADGEGMASDWAQSTSGITSVGGGTPTNFAGVDAFTAFVVSPDEVDIVFGVDVFVRRSSYNDGDLSASTLVWGSTFGTLNGGASGGDGRLKVPSQLLMNGNWVFLMDADSQCIGRADRDAGGNKTQWACQCGSGSTPTDGAQTTVATCPGLLSMTMTEDGRVMYLSDSFGRIRKVWGGYIATRHTDDSGLSVENLLVHPIYEDVFLWVHTGMSGGLRTLVGTRDEKYRPSPGLTLKEGNWGTSNFKLSKGLALNTRNGCLYSVAKQPVKLQIFSHYALIQTCSLWNYSSTATVTGSETPTLTRPATSSRTLIATSSSTGSPTGSGVPTPTASTTPSLTQDVTATRSKEPTQTAEETFSGNTSTTTRTKSLPATPSQEATGTHSESSSLAPVVIAASSSEGSTSPVPTELNRTACAEQPGQHDRLVHIQPTPDSVPAAQAAADPMTIRVQLPSTASPVGGSSVSSGSGSSSATANADVSWHPDVRQISGRVIAGPAAISRNTTGLTRVSGSEVDLVLKINDGAALDEDATVTIEFTHGSFVWWTACPSTISQHVSVELTTLLGEPLPEAVRTSSKVVGTTGATVSVFTSGTGSLAMITSRASSIVAISACAFSHTAPLDFSLAPMGLEVGPARGAFYRGGILGNSLLLLISALAIGLVLAATHFGFKDEGWTSSCHRLHFPGILLLPYVLLLPGALSCCVAIVRHGVGPGDIALGVLGGLLWIVPALGCAIYFTTGRKFDCVFQGDKAVKAENQAAGITVGALEYHLLGLGHWKDKGRGFKYHWGVLFMDYCHERQWFVVVELIFTALCAVIEGFKPTTIQGCQYSLILYFALALLMLAVVLGCRPCVSTFNSLHMIGMAILLFVSTLLLLVGGLKGKGFEDVSAAGAYVAVIITYFSLIKSLVDIVATVQRRSRGLRNLLARRNKAARNNVTLTLDAGSQQQVLSVALLEEPPVLEEAELVLPEQGGLVQEEMRSVGVAPSPTPSPPPEPETLSTPVPQQTVVAPLPTNQKKAAGPCRGAEGQQLYDEIRRGLQYGLHGTGSALAAASSSGGDTVFQTANLHDLDLEDVLNAAGGEGDEEGGVDDLLDDDLLGDFRLPVPPRGDLSAEEREMLDCL